MAQPDRVVRISLDPRGMPVPDQDPVRVKKAEQKVKWCADFPFTIDIDGYSDVNPGGADPDGAHTCKTGFFGQQKKYKYAITANGNKNDPELDIQP